MKKTAHIEHRRRGEEELGEKVLVASHWKEKWVGRSTREDAPNGRVVWRLRANPIITLQFPRGRS